MLPEFQFPFANFHEQVFKDVRKLGYLGQSKEATPALDGMNSPEKLVHDLGGIALFQLGQAFLQFLKLFPHFHEEILKYFVFRYS